MKLFEVPENTRIKIGELELNFHHVDGMYSYCTTDDGKVVHPSAFTDVEIVEKKDERYY